MSSNEGSKRVEENFNNYCLQVQVLVEKGPCVFIVKYCFLCPPNYYCSYSNVGAWET